MKRLFCALGQLAMLPLFFGVLMLPGKADAWDSLVCYRWTIFPNERYKLAIHSEVDLSTWDEEQNFNHPHHLP